MRIIKNKRDAFWIGTTVGSIFIGILLLTFLLVTDRVVIKKDGLNEYCRVQASKEYTTRYSLIESNAALLHLEAPAFSAQLIRCARQAHPSTSLGTLLSGCEVGGELPDGHL